MNRLEFQRRRQNGYKLSHAYPAVSGNTGTGSSSFDRVSGRAGTVFEKGEVIFHAGSPITRIGLVLSGSVNMVVPLYWGASRIFGHMAAGEIFGENYAAVPGKELVGDIVAAQSSRILFLDLRKVYTVCSHGCPFHHRLIENLLQISAQKNLQLAERMLHTSSRTIRDRVLSYLSAQSREHGSAHFTIPFDRQQLADYLGVERSALSAELGK